MQWSYDLDSWWILWTDQYDWLAFKGIKVFGKPTTVGYKWDT